MSVGTDRVRWGIVGTGGISRQIAADFAHVAEAHVAAVSSRDVDKAESFGAEYGIGQRFAGVEDLLASDVDAVYIGTPHATHFDIASAAIRAGKHVLCEKPLAMNAPQVRELTELARNARVFLMEAMWMAFTPMIRRLVELADGGELGDVRSVHANFGAAFALDGSSRWLPGGSTLLDQGIYPVNLAHLLLGRPRSIQAAGAIRDDGVDLRGRFTFEYSDGKFAQGAYSMVEWLDQSASVSGTTGCAALGAGFWFSSRMTLTSAGPGGPPREETLEFDREGFGYVPMLRATTAAILAGELEHPLHSAEATIEVFETMDEIRRQIAAAG